MQSKQASTSGSTMSCPHAHGSPVRHPSCRHFSVWVPAAGSHPCSGHQTSVSQLAIPRAQRRLHSQVVASCGGGGSVHSVTARHINGTTVQQAHCRRRTTCMANHCQEESSTTPVASASTPAAPMQGSDSEPTSSSSSSSSNAANGGGGMHDNGGNAGGHNHRRAAEGGERPKQPLWFQVCNLSPA